MAQLNEVSSEIYEDDQTLMSQHCRASIFYKSDQWLNFNFYLLKLGQSQ